MTLPSLDRVAVFLSVPPNNVAPLGGPTSLSQSPCDVLFPIGIVTLNFAPNIVSLPPYPCRSNIQGHNLFLQLYNLGLLSSSPLEGWLVLPPLSPWLLFFVQLLSTAGAFLDSGYSLSLGRIGQKLKGLIGLQSELLLYLPFPQN